MNSIPRSIAPKRISIVKISPPNRTFLVKNTLTLHTIPPVSKQQIIRPITFAPLPKKNESTTRPFKHLHATKAFQQTVLPEKFIVARFARRSLLKPFKISLDTTGGVVDALVPPKKHDFTSFSGITQFLRTRIYRPIVVRYFLYHLKNKLKKTGGSFNKSEFYNHTKDMYIQYVKSIANHDMHALRNVCSERYFTKAKSLSIPTKPNLTVKFDVNVKKFTLISLFVAPVPKVLPAVEFAQAIFRVNSDQTLAIYDKDKLVAGSDEPVAVDEYLVVERQVTMKGSTWKILDIMKK